MTSKRNKFKLFLDRTLSNKLSTQIGILAGLSVATLLLSFILLSFSGSDWRSFCESKDIKPWLLPIYLLIDANALNVLYLGGNVHGWMLFASSLTYLCGIIIFNGMLIGVITNYIGNRVQNHRDGLIHYLKSGHYVIMGYDEMVPSVIEEIFAKDKDAFILLLTAFDTRKIKEWLKKSVAKKQLDQIIINYGLRTAKEYYDEIHLEAATEVYIVGNRSRPAHDATNVECVDSIYAYLKENKSGLKPKRITCVFEDLDTYAAFKTTEIFRKIRDLGIEFVPYNFYSGWSRQVFVSRSYREKIRAEKTEYPSVYGDGITPDDKKHVHLVFVGTSYFSVSFAMEAAHLLHFPNFEKHNSLRTRITFIEKNADEELKIFATRNRHFFEVQPYYYRDLTEGYHPNEKDIPKKDLLSKDLEQTGFLDVEFEFIKGDVYSSDVQKLIKDWALQHDNTQFLSIFLAMSNQRDNFVMGMNMPDEVYDNNVPIFIRQDRADDFVTNLREADDNEKLYYQIEDNKMTASPRKGRYANIYPFGMDDMAYFSDEIALKQAKLINYLYCNSSNNRFPSELVLSTLPENSIWKDADEAWQSLKVAEKWSNLYSAYSIRCKLDSLRTFRELDKDDHSRDKQPLSLEEIEFIAAVEHNRWNVEKLLMGYRKAKPSEDKYIHTAYADEWKSNKKNFYIHHDIRPFNSLGEIQQMDYEIAKYIPWILKMTEK